MHNQNLLLTIGGVFSTDVHNIAKEIASNVVTKFVHIKYPGAPICFDKRITELKNTLIKTAGDLEYNSNLALIAKSAGAVLAWRFVTTNPLFVSSMFKKTSILLIDAHGTAFNDGVTGTYCRRRPLRFPERYPRDLFKRISWTSVRQQNSGLTGAYIDHTNVDNRLILAAGTNHMNIVSDKTTVMLIESTLRNAFNARS